MAEGRLSNFSFGATMQMPNLSSNVSLSKFKIMNFFHFYPTFSGHQPRHMGRLNLLGKKDAKN